jgi:hypothetical protein
VWCWCLQLIWGTTTRCAEHLCVTCALIVNSHQQLRKSEQHEQKLADT